MSDLALTYVVCRNDGTTVAEADKALVRRVEFKRNVPATATLTIQLDDSLAVYLTPGACRLKIYRAATPAELAANPAAVKSLIFYGQLPSQGVDQDVPGNKVTCTFQDPRWRFNQLYTNSTSTFSLTSQGSILWQIVAQQIARSGGSFIALLQGATDTSHPRDRTYDLGKNVAELVNQLTQVEGGPDVDVTPTEISGAGVMGFFNTYERQGFDRPAVVFVHGIDLNNNYAGLKQTFGDTITSATWQGTDLNGSTVVQTFDQAAYSGFGLLEEFGTASDVSVLATLLSKATGTVVTNQEPQPVMELQGITSQAPMPLVDFYIGDTVRVTERWGPINYDRKLVRVEGFALEADANGEVKTTQLTATVTA